VTFPIPTFAKPFKYKKQRTARPERLNRIKQETDSEGLTGYVHGLKASDLEERSARSLNKMDIDFNFQFEVTTAFTLPGEERKVDFVVRQGLGYAYEIDEVEFIHRGAAAQQEDLVRDALINEKLAKLGIQPIVHIPSTDLETQELSDETWRALHG
jgi:hypothetical protein